MCVSRSVSSMFVLFDQCVHVVAVMLSLLIMPRGIV